MDAEEIVLPLLQRLFTEENKLHLHQLKYLNLERCGGCYSFNENVGESSILKLNLWNHTKQLEVNLFSVSVFFRVSQNAFLHTFFKEPPRKLN